MDVQQFFKRDHVKMSSLFDKLATTSNSALKTRERLFVALRLEIEAHRTVVEDHLHPLLSKHRETRRLKPTAREINQLDRQLSRVEALDKDDPGFLPKVRELKKTMENRLREERRIVPVLKKALEPEAFQELARELADGKREEQQEARQRKKGGADSGGGRKSGSQENPGAGESNGQFGAQQVVRQVSEAVTAPSGIARSAQALHHTLADAVVEGLRVNTEACLEALRRMGMPAPWGLHGLIAQWMRLNIDVGSRVTRAFLGAFTSADGISRR